MIRISRLTDYGIVLMRYMAAHPDDVHNATEVAAGARLPLPTVSKLLRILARGGLLESHRGVKGGYCLARPADGISVADIIRALEGPIALTTCATVSDEGDCEHGPLCPVRGHWHQINLAIRQALERIPLSDMAVPPHARFMSSMPVARPSPAGEPPADLTDARRLAQSPR